MRAHGILVVALLAACRGGEGPDVSAHEASANEDAIADAIADAIVGDSGPTRTCAPAQLGDAVEFTSVTGFCGGGDFALDAHAAYWSPDCESIYRCDRPACAGGPTRVVDGEAVRAIASDGVSLFWISPPTGADPIWSLRSCPVDDGSLAHRTTVFRTDLSLYLAVDATTLTFAQHTTIGRCTKNHCGGTAHSTSLITTNGWLGLAVDDRNVFACDYTKSEIDFVSNAFDTEPPSSIPLPTRCSSIAVDDSDIFLDGPEQRTTRIAKPGCCSALGACVSELPFGPVLGVDESDLFYLDDVALRIMRVPKHR